MKDEDTSKVITTIDEYYDSVIHNLNELYSTLDDDDARIEKAKAKLLDNFIKDLNNIHADNIISYVARIVEIIEELAKKFNDSSSSLALLEIKTLVAIRTPPSFPLRTTDDTPGCGIPTSGRGTRGGRPRMKCRTLGSIPPVCAVPWKALLSEIKKS